MSPDPVKCPECGSTQIGHTTKGGVSMTAGQINEGLFEGTLSGMGSTMHRGGTFYNACMACGYEWSPAAVIAAKEKSAREQKEKMEEANFNFRFNKWRDKLIRQLSPILGDNKEERKAFVDYLEEQKETSYGNLNGLSLDELDSLIRPSNLKNHPWVNFKKGRGGCRFYLLMLGLVWPVTLWITFSQITDDNYESHESLLYFGFMAVPIACIPLLLFKRLVQGNSAQKQLESVYHPTAEFKAPKRLAGQEIKQGFTPEEKAVSDEPPKINQPKTTSGPIKKKSTKAYNAEQEDIIASMVESGSGVEEIAEAVGKTVASVRGKLLSMGLKAPQRSQSTSQINQPKTTSGEVDKWKNALQKLEQQHTTPATNKDATAASSKPISGRSPTLFFVKKGHVVRRLSSSELKAAVANGEFGANDHIRKSENDKWTRLSNVKGLNF